MAQKLRKTIQNTKIFFHKTLQNFKSFLVVDYPNKLSESCVIKKIFCRWNANQKIPKSDKFWQNTLDEVMGNDKIQDKEREQEECNESIISMPASATSNMTIEGEQVERKHENRQRGIQRGQSSRSIARKLKELEMLEPRDVEHVLDVEEVLHYYSRLTSPAYAEIIDRFCTDMHNENSVQHPSVSISANSSMRRNGSLRRLGPVKL